MCSWKKGLFFLVSFMALATTQLFAQLDSANIPLFIIDTHGQSIEDEPKINADLKIIYHPGEYHHQQDSGNIYSGKIGIEIRGRYSASLPQKPYGIETRDALGENLNVPLFHMPEENDWILLANYNDKTFMRNSLTFELFRKMGRYAPRTQFCEVVVNNYYQGIYVFTEKIKRDKNRVDIAKLTPEENQGEDLTGGYIFKVDYFNDYNSWQSAFAPLGHPQKKVHFVYEYPDEDEISPEQKAYLRNHINEFEALLYSSKYSLSRVSKYIDIHSFIDYFIINELARNVDAYKKSSYFYKERDSNGGLIHMGPVWDFDWAWKNINECMFGAQDGSGWAYKVHDCDPWPVPPTWMNKLMRDPSVTRLLSDRYFSLRASYLSNEAIFSYIDSVANVLDEPQARHYNKWRILGVNVGAPETDQQPSTYAGEIDKFKNWISTRLRWLDNNIPNMVITDLDEIASQDNLKMYPNPCSSQMVIESSKNIYELGIYALNGAMVYSDTSIKSSKSELDVAMFPPGVYTLKLKLEDGSLWTEKLVKID